MAFMRGQNDSPIASLGRKAEKRVMEHLANAPPPRLGKQKEQPQPRRHIILAGAKDRADGPALSLGNQAAFPRRVVIFKEGFKHMLDQRPETFVKLFVPGIKLGMDAGDPIAVRRPRSPDDQRL